MKLSPQEHHKAYFAQM